MKLLLVSAVFPPEPVVSARLSYDLHGYLRDSGHFVKVVCPLPSRGGQTDDPAMHRSVSPEIFRVNSYRCVASRLVGRARESWDFGRQAGRLIQDCVRKDGLDAVYANVWPMFGQSSIVNTARALGVPVVLHVQDVYPESLRTKLPSWVYRGVARGLTAWDRRMVSRCSAVLLISSRICRAYAASRGIGERARVVRNWVDASPFEAAHDRALVCAEYDVPAERFTFMYLGNLSALSSLDTAIRAFATVPEGVAQLVIIGEGSMKKDCESLAYDLGVRWVLFRSEPDPARVARVQSMADAFVLPTRSGAALSSTPSKCISYMLSGKPIIAAVDEETDAADDLRDSRCGWLCRPGDVPGLRDLLQTALRTDLATRQAMGGRGRKYALANFSRQTCLQQVAGIVEESARNRSRGSLP